MDNNKTKQQKNAAFKRTGDYFKDVGGFDLEKQANAFSGGHPRYKNLRNGRLGILPKDEAQFNSIHPDFLRKYTEFLESGEPEDKDEALRLELQRAIDHLKGMAGDAVNEYEREIEYLKTQLALKDEIIRAKDDQIKVLMAVMPGSLSDG